MPARCVPLLLRTGSALGVVLLLACCTPGGQFDPTTLINIDTKKKIPGDREPLFPNGVPGVENGVPQDLVKGYKPPSDQASESADTAASPTVIGTPPTKIAGIPEPAKPKPKSKHRPRPKPKAVRAAEPDRKRAQSTQANRPASPSSVGASQTNWPAPPPTGGAAQTNWPPAPSTGASAQTNWPPPPSTGGTAAAQTNWPPPPSTAPAQ